MTTDLTAPATETRRLTQVVRERLAERRSALAAAVREHEARAFGFAARAEAIRLHQRAIGHPAVPRRPSDHALYSAWRALQEPRS